MTSMPSVFLSHGAPTLVEEPHSPARAALVRLGSHLARPSAILAVSAHWSTDIPTVSSAVQPSTVHDFYGFPQSLYRLAWPAPGAPWLARQVTELLAGAGMEAASDPGQGLDHGAWVPLMLMYPGADIPVVQLSVQPGRDMAAHLALGRALAPLRRDGVLIMASGSSVHNLRSYRPGSPAVAGWATDFAGWLDRTLAAGDEAALAQWRQQAPGAAMAHPTDEHLLPLGVALGAAGPAPRSEAFHSGFEHGSLGMHAWLFTAASA
jgi:4,5-DOPA dioxygenase extradiol